MDCKTLNAITGIYTFSSKLPEAPAIETVVSLPITCAHTMVIASHCVGLTLPGIIELPGSFSGRLISPMPHRGPLPSQRISFAILLRAHARVFRAELASISASRAPRASNLLGEVMNGNSVRSAIA